MAGKKKEEDLDAFCCNVFGKISGKSFSDDNTVLANQKLLILTRANGIKLAKNAYLACLPGTITPPNFFPNGKRDQACNLVHGTYKCFVQITSDQIELPCEAGYREEGCMCVKS